MCWYMQGEDVLTAQKKSRLKRCVLPPNVIMCIHKRMYFFQTFKFYCKLGHNLVASMLMRGTLLENYSLAQENLTWALNELQMNAG